MRCLTSVNHSLAAKLTHFSFSTTRQLSLIDTHTFSLGLNGTEKKGAWCVVELSMRNHKSYLAGFL